MKDPKGQDERLVYALTHLAEAGHGDLVKDWQGDKDPMTAGIALRVPSTEDAVREHLAGVSSGSGAFEGARLAHGIWQKQKELSDAQA